MDSVSPVLTEREIPAEQVIALGQDEYFSIVVVRVVFADGSLVSYTRFRFSGFERELIARGADLVLGQPHNSAMMPISLQLAMPGEYPVQEDK